MIAIGHKSPCSIKGMLRCLSYVTLSFLTCSPTADPPSYVNPGDQTFVEGQMNVGVDVGLDANPIGDFTWTRNSMPITADNVWLTASNITFNPVRWEDTGLYIISGNNTAGSNSTSFRVTVNCKLQISLSDKNYMWIIALKKVS